MALGQKVNVEQVDFSTIKTAGEVLRVFIQVARTVPEQSSVLFDKYAAYVGACNKDFTAEQSRRVAANNISLLSEIYGSRTHSLLCRTYEGLRQH